MAAPSEKPPAGKGDKNAPVDLSMIGPYKLVTNIASGNHSQVWEALTADGQRRIAVKFLYGEAVKDQEQLTAIKNEFTVGKQLEHPSIIKFLDGHWGTLFKKEAYFTMELFMSPNLKAQLFSNLNSVQVRFKRIVESCAMAFAHIQDKGFIHRDIKPDNILVSKSGEVKVIDFSLAGRPAGALSKVFAGKSKTAKGTRSYMAPEQILRKPLSFQVDMYAFGITLFEMLTGQPPFTGSTPNDLLMRHIQELPPPPSMINPNVTEEMDRVVLRLLSKKPEQRHKTFNEFLAEFRKLSPWKEEVVEKRELSETEKAQQEIGNTLGERLDSRTDAMRTALGVAPPPKKKPATPSPAEKPAAKPAAAAAPTPAPPAAAPGYAPGMPLPAGMMPAGFAPQYPQGGYPAPYPQGQFPPGQIPPGMFPPGQYPAAQFPPGQFPPGQFAPGQFPPGMFPTGPLPPGQAPQVPYPGATLPPGQVPSGQPRSAAPGTPGAARPQPPRPPAGAVPPAAAARPA
ncbi:MAG: protein kinase domain-containing protein, partial [Planctomycetaceae bacterium]